MKDQSAIIRIQPVKLWFFLLRPDVSAVVLLNAFSGFVKS